MGDKAREAYISGIDARFVPVVRALDRAVEAAGAGFDTDIKYRMLTYAVGGDYRRWVCAIGVTAKLVNLRFLYGFMLDDPRGLFRGAKDSPLRTIDYASLEDVDEQVVTDYVKEAASKFDAFKAKERAGEVPSSVVKDR